MPARPPNGGGSQRQPHHAHRTGEFVGVLHDRYSDSTKASTLNWNLRTDVADSECPSVVLRHGDPRKPPLAPLLDALASLPRRRARAHHVTPAPDAVVGSPLFWIQQRLPRFRRCAARCRPSWASSRVGSQRTVPVDRRLASCLCRDPRMAFVRFQTCSRAARGILPFLCAVLLLHRRYVTHRFLALNRDDEFARKRATHGRWLDSE